MGWSLKLISEIKIPDQRFRRHCGSRVVDDEKYFSLDETANFGLGLDHDSAINSEIHRSQFWILFLNQIRPLSVATTDIDFIPSELDLIAIEFCLLVCDLLVCLTSEDSGESLSIVGSMAIWVPVDLNFTP